MGPVAHAVEGRIDGQQENVSLSRGKARSRLRAVRASSAAAKPRAME
ncbi:MAG: hypothetical protein ACXW5U_02685 [Thermoanaerobaculia bacterium]